MAFLTDFVVFSGPGVKSFYYTEKDTRTILCNIFNFIY